MTPQSADDPRFDLAAEARGPLTVLYRELDEAVAALAPVCAMSGRCCRFAEYGHTLFLTAPEAAVLIADAPPPVRALDDGLTCPWQDHQGRCAARGARPLGCRVYFCDPAYEDQAPPLTERFLGRLRRLAADRGWDWRYAPLHRHLEDALHAGTLAIPPSSLGGSPGDRAAGSSRDAGV